MNKKQTVIILGLILLTGIISMVILNYYISVEFESNNTSGQLKEILGNCNCQEKIKSLPESNERCTQELIDWQNSTHYIDNNLCKWIES